MKYLDGAVLPAAIITLTEEDGSTVSLDGYTMSVRVGPTGGAAIFEKTTGFTINANVLTVAWTTEELAQLAPNVYELNVIATAGDGKRRKWKGLLHIGKSLGPPE